MERSPIIFLGVEGVLLTRRAWGMPINAAARELRGKNYRAEGAAAADAVTLDAVGIGLVNRLCDVAKAKIVISSDWLVSLGYDQTRCKLENQGILAGHFHCDYAIQCGFAIGDKGRYIAKWLEDHRVGAVPAMPSDRSPASLTAWRIALHDIGVPFVVLDDEGPYVNLVRTSSEDGLTCGAYRIACRALGGVDTDMGVHRIKPNDWKRLLGAFGGRVVSAAYYLDGGDSRWESLALEGGGPLPEGFWERLAEYQTLPRSATEEEMDF